MVSIRVLLTLPKEIVDKLDDYAKQEHMGKRSYAVWYILKEYFADKGD